MRTESFARLFEQSGPIAFAVFAVLLTCVVFIWFATRS